MGWVVDGKWRGKNESRELLTKRVGYPRVINITYIVIHKLTTMCVFRKRKKCTLSHFMEEERVIISFERKERILAEC